MMHNSLMTILGPCLDAEPLACLSERDGDPATTLPAGYGDACHRVISAFGDGFGAGYLDGAESVGSGEKGNGAGGVE